MEEWSKTDYQFKIANISRFSNLLIAMNITLFVASGLVSGMRYYFPLIALALLFVVQMVITMPIFIIRGRKNFVALFSIVWLSVYFTISSVIYMVQHGDFKQF
ncbi:MAG: hypothetical protein HN353_09585 [Bdellovibrionales bacterium]|jgi:hypothetical protein|nr:hypothetical protein [Bdellovibrionales bacterium]MBT3525763.1 hypothetical protein [Bdellovibrionales bacterium]MBT7668946.1 hypothetical protein [Bdellovibrionales bacterium]MBT7768151.1 hypothetical protein [Bdellovibrionales bacterium]